MSSLPISHTRLSLCLSPSPSPSLASLCLSLCLLSTLFLLLLALDPSHFRVFFHLFSRSFEEQRGQSWRGSLYSFFAFTHARFLECTFCQIQNLCLWKRKGKERKEKKRKNISQKWRAFMYESALMNLESDRNELITFISFGENDKRTLYPLFTNIFVP